jgi:hypothetical protein
LRAPFWERKDGRGERREEEEKEERESGGSNGVAIVLIRPCSSMRGPAAERRFSLIAVYLIEVVDRSLHGIHINYLNSRLLVMGKKRMKKVAC